MTSWKTCHHLDSSMNKIVLLSCRCTLAAIQLNTNNFLYSVYFNVGLLCSDFWWCWSSFVSFLFWGSLVCALTWTQRSYMHCTQNFKSNQFLFWGSQVREGTEAANSWHKRQVVIFSAQQPWKLKLLVTGWWISVVTEEATVLVDKTRHKMTTFQFICFNLCSFSSLHLGFF